MKSTTFKSPRRTFSTNEYRFKLVESKLRQNSGVTKHKGDQLMASIIYQRQISRC